METKLQVFYNETSNVNIRMEQVDGEPWFVAKDVCTALELSEVSNTVKRLDEDEKLTRTVFVSGQGREMWFINESGLYNLIFQSRKPEARAFRRWVTNEVLPAIRRTGAFKQQDEAHDHKKLPLPKYRPFYAEWKERVSPYISVKEIHTVAYATDVSECHVKKVYRGTSVSERITVALTTLARENRDGGVVYPEKVQAYEQLVIEWDDNK